MSKYLSEYADKGKIRPNRREAPRVWGVTDFVHYIELYHPEYIRPCIPSEVRWLAFSLGVHPKRIVAAVNILLSERE